MKGETVLKLERRDLVARMILSRPSAGNSIDLHMAESFSRAAQQCAADASIRCVVLTGEGKLFCGGGDVRSFAEAGSEAPQLIRAITRNLHAGVSCLMRMEKPLVTIINGPAGGAGMSLACLGDIAIAAQSAHFTSGYTALGLVPDGGLTWMLPRLVGLRRAQELIVTNRRVSAPDAADLGLITRAVPDAGLSEAEAEATELLATGATAAFGRLRQLLLGSSAADIEAQMEEESREISALAGSPHGREGIAAFAAKRRPVFT